VQQHTVYVWGKPHAVITHQRSKSVWLAYGNHLGKPITVKARSEGAALLGSAARCEYMRTAQRVLGLIRAILPPKRALDVQPRVVVVGSRRRPFYLVADRKLRTAKTKGEALDPALFTDAQRAEPDLR